MSRDKSESTILYLIPSEVEGRGEEDDDGNLRLPFGAIVSNALQGVTAEIRVLV